MQLADTDDLALWCANSENFSSALTQLQAPLPARSPELVGFPSVFPPSGLCRYWLLHSSRAEPRVLFA